MKKINIFTDFKIKNIHIKNRIVLPPMVRFSLVKDDGYVTQDLIDWYGMIARSGVGLIIVEASAVEESGKLLESVDLLVLDLSLKKGSIGYVLNKDYWNQGLATEATKAVIALAFEQLGMNKLIAVHDQDNPASGRVMAKSGMKYSHEEPYAMLDLHEEGRMVTRVHYVLTKEEYLSEK